MANRVSRGLEPNLSIHSKLWWNSPPWSDKDVNEWPIGSFPVSVNEIPEERKCSHACLTNIEDTNAFSAVSCKYSSFVRLKSILAYVL